jgi:alkylation response protein AidB-like acyl-CoA dehydrogenase
MRYKAVFIAGVAVGFMAGSRAGRGAYDRIISSGRKIAQHPKVQQAAGTVQAKAADLTKTAAAKAPDYAKSAATNATAAAKTASTQVPKIVSNAKHAATDKIPARFGGAGGGTDADDVAADGNLVYPADGASPSVNGTRYTPDTP